LAAIFPFIQSTVTATAFTLDIPNYLNNSEKNKAASPQLADNTFL
jgi:hypothetical protein